MATLHIVDYGVGNIRNVCRLVRAADAEPALVVDKAGLRAATHVVLPGVGALPEAMRKLDAIGMVGPLTEAARAGRIMLLGVCVGMQMLADHSTEAGGGAGLGLIAGRVDALQPEEGERIPHVGWNEVQHAKPGDLVDGVGSGKDFYFTHRFHLIPQDEDVVLARTPYCGGFVSMLQRDNVLGAQFHPELSGAGGLAVLRNFLMM